MNVSSVTIFIDDIPAAVSITAPAEGAQRSALSPLTGNLTDEFSGVQKAVLRISYLAAGTSNYWQGSALGWTTTPSVVSTDAVTVGALSSAWAYADVPAPWTTGREYRIDAWGVDQAGNGTVSTTTVNWLFDASTGTASVTDPSANGTFRSTYTALNVITGTAVEAPVHAFAKVDEVEVRITRDNDDSSFSYWNGLDWVSASDTWISSAGWNAASVSWSIAKATCPTQGVADWCDNRSYDINARVYDKAVPTRNLSSWTTRQFTYDSTPPNGVITDPNTAFEDASSFSGGDIYGTATDGGNARRSKIKTVEIAIRNPDVGAPDIGPSNWWDGTAFSIAQAACGDATVGGCWIAASTTPEVALNVNWLFTSTPTWQDNRRYRVRARITDFAGNTTFKVWDFKYDNTGVPGVAVSTPVPNGNYKTSSLVQVTGTASNSFQVLSASVAVREKDTVPPMCWSVASGTFSVASVAGECPDSAWYLVDTLTGGPPNYEWTRSTPTFGDGFRYQAAARALAQSGKTNQTAYVDFLYDITPPTSTVSIPASGAFIKTLASIQGTAVDPLSSVPNSNPFASGIAGGGGVEIAMRRNSDNAWWQGGAFGNVHVAPPGAPDWRPVDCVGCGPGWQKTTGLPAAMDMSAGQYTLYSRAYDVARNTQTALATPSPFTWDVAGPSVSLSTPSGASQAAYSALSLIGGTAQDANNITAIEYRIKKFDGTFWTGAGFGVMTWLPASTGTPTGSLLAWTTTYLPTFTEDSNENWEIDARALDAAGNYSAVYSTAIFRYDTTAPVSITTNVVEGSTITTYHVVAGTGTESNGLSLQVADFTLRIYDATNGSCYDGTNGANPWTPGCAGGGWLNVSDVTAYASTYSWSYTKPVMQSDAMWTSSHTYKINVRAKDAAVPPNLEVNYATRTFTFDNQPPITITTYPANDRAYGVAALGATALSAPLTRGAMSDDAAGMAGVKVSIRDQNNSNTCFDGTAFGAACPS
ncbi:MAG: hypothetical protein AAB262_11620, partial [Elusimicrobiota bacterium]